jgi:hypothetical protein
MIKGQRRRSSGMANAEGTAHSARRAPNFVTDTSGVLGKEVGAIDSSLLWEQQSTYLLACWTLFHSPWNWNTLSAALFTGAPPSSAFSNSKVHRYSSFVHIACGGSFVPKLAGQQLH